MPDPSAEPPGTRSAATLPPGILAALLNTLNGTSFMTSVNSVNSILTRKSGLSEPYFAIAISCVMTGNGFGNSVFMVLAKIWRIMFSKRSRISCSPTKDISQSIWVNSALAIRSQILIAEAFRNLVITVESGNHQQLLEQLGRLRQREKFSRIDP